jgi:hypothetical protein
VTAPGIEAPGGETGLGPDDALSRAGRAAYDEAKAAPWPGWAARRDGTWTIGRMAAPRRD